MVTRASARNRCTELTRRPDNNRPLYHAGCSLATGDCIDQESCSDQLTPASGLRDRTLAHQTLTTAVIQGFASTIASHMSVFCAHSWEGSNLAYNQNGPRQILVDWIHGTGKTSTAFDFPTKGILQALVRPVLLQQHA